jgi:hypothetical protein
MWSEVGAPEHEMMTSNTDFRIENNPNPQSQTPPSNPSQIAVYRSFCQELLDSPRWGRGAFNKFRRDTLMSIAEVLGLQLNRAQKRDSRLLRQRLDADGEELREKIAQNPNFGDKIQKLFQEQAVLSAVPQKGISPIGFVKQNGAVVGSSTGGKFLNRF